MSRDLHKFAKAMPEAFRNFGEAYYKKLSKMTGEELKEKFYGENLEKIKAVFPEKFMDEDFRAKNIGTTFIHCRRDYSAVLKEAEESIQKFEKERIERLKGCIYRPVFGVRISDDHGNTWKMRALCDECYHSIEPPTRAKNEGAAGANCDWCGAFNEQLKK